MGKRWIGELRGVLGLVWVCGMLAGGDGVMHGVLIGCSFVCIWTISVLVMRVGACADERYLMVGVPGCNAANCVGSSGGVVFRDVSCLLS